MPCPMRQFLQHSFLPDDLILQAFTSFLNTIEPRTHRLDEFVSIESTPPTFSPMSRHDFIRRVASVHKLFERFTEFWKIDIYEHLQAIKVKRYFLVDFDHQIGCFVVFKFTFHEAQGWLTAGAY